jgi:uncharacterized iron-regulated membrane protein
VGVVYLIAMALSGTVMLFYPQIYRAVQPSPKVLQVGNRLPPDALRAAVLQRYPGGHVSWIWASSENPAVEVWIQTAEFEAKRLVDPYTGRDLGSSTSRLLPFLNAIREFHINLLLHEHGRISQFAGGFAITLVALSGIVLWWPRSAKWTRHLGIRRAARGTRLAWESHRAVGFWSSCLVLALSGTGAMLALQSRGFLGDRALDWMYRIHTGLFAGEFVRTLVLCAAMLALLALSVTGALVSWKRARVSFLRSRPVEPFIWPVRRLRTDRKPASVSLRHSL